MYKPWFGKDYATTRTLILGESTYDWERNGKLNHPSPDHSTDVARNAIDYFETTSSFARTITRALCGTKDPGKTQRKAGWNKIAFTNYIETSVGTGARTRPSDVQWKHANDVFKRDLEKMKVKPRRIVVLGREMWSRMPETDVFFTEEVQGYQLRDGSLVMCCALAHPARGLSWNSLAAALHFALPNELPL